MLMFIMVWTFHVPIFIHISVTHSDSLPPSIIWGSEKNSVLGKASKA